METVDINFLRLLQLDKLTQHHCAGVGCYLCAGASEKNAAWGKEKTGFEEGFQGHLLSLVGYVGAVGTRLHLDHAVQSEQTAVFGDNSGVDFNLANLYIV